MRLRPRLALSIVGVVVPLVGSMIVLDAMAREQAGAQELARFLEVEVKAPGFREACFEDPVRFRGRSDADLPDQAPPGLPDLAPPDSPDLPPPGEPIEGGPPRSLIGGDFSAAHPRPHSEPARFYGYDGQLRSPSPGAPELDPILVEDMVGAAPIVPATSIWDRTVMALVRTPGVTDGGPCSFILAVGTTEPWLGALLPDTRVWLTPLVAVLITALVAVGPVLRRIRKLSLEVQRVAESDYSVRAALSGSDEISDLAVAFDRASARVRGHLAEAQQREQALRDFLANTTHDIMIPLTVLQGHLAKLADAAATEGGADSRTIGAAMDEAHYVGSLLHNLAMVAKLEAAAPELGDGEVDLSALVHRVAARHRPVARELGVSLEFALPDEAVEVQGDVTMLEQALSNLVYNAVRHNQPGGHVAILLEVADEGGFSLRVIDDGPGIPTGELSKMASRGYRGEEARSRGVPGQGLGLDITSRVAQRHGLQFNLRPSAFGGLEAELSGRLRRSARP